MCEPTKPLPPTTSTRRGTTEDGAAAAAEGRWVMASERRMEQSEERRNENDSGCNFYRLDAAAEESAPGIECEGIIRISTHT
jgi:hypothetical protein